MAKKGGSKHFVRITAHSLIPIQDKKEHKWMMRPMPGPHPKFDSMPLGVLLRDILKVTRDSKESKTALNSGAILIDGKKVHDIRRPIGLMDIVSISPQNKHYRIEVRAGKLAPSELSAGEAGRKFCQIKGKNTLSGGRTNFSFHDGRNLISKEKMAVRDTVVFELPAMKVSKVIPFKPGVKCMVTSGKHAGELAVLEEIVSTKGSLATVARLKGASGEFTTSIGYLFAVDDSFAW
jgi:small subunit ribosomal protein S4e